MPDHNPTLLNFQRAVSEWAHEGKTPPPPDAYDEAAFPYGKEAGANKLGLRVCATCGKPPTQTGRNDCPEAFLFRSHGSAREYYISGMCQACQNSVFGLDDNVTCAECGKVVPEKDADVDGNYAFCSYECHGRFVGVFP